MRELARALESDPSPAAAPAAAPAPAPPAAPESFLFELLELRYDFARQQVSLEGSKDVFCDVERHSAPIGSPPMDVEKTVSYTRQSSQVFRVTEGERHLRSEGKHVTLGFENETSVQAGAQFKVINVSGTYRIRTTSSTTTTGETQLTTETGSSSETHYLQAMQHTKRVLTRLDAHQECKLVITVRRTRFEVPFVARILRKRHAGDAGKIIHISGVNRGFSEDVMDTNVVKYPMHPLVVRISNKSSTTDTTTLADGEFAIHTLAIADTATDRFVQLRFLGCSEGMLECASNGYSHPREMTSIFPAKRHVTHFGLRNYFRKHRDDHATAVANGTLKERHRDLLKSNQWVEFYVEDFSDLIGLRHCQLQVRVHKKELSNERLFVTLFRVDSLTDPTRNALWQQKIKPRIEERDGVCRYPLVSTAGSC